MNIDVKFHDDTHKQKFDEICRKMKSHDCYHLAAAYLISLDRECRRHISDLFDFSKDIVKTEGINKAWQTGTSRKSTRLMFNLWSDRILEDDEDGNSVSCYYTVSDIFCCEYAPYYYEAIKLRYPDYT